MFSCRCRTKQLDNPRERAQLKTSPTLAIHQGTRQLERRTVYIYITSYIGVDMMAK